MANPNITPFDIYMGNCPLASSAQACILQLFQAYHSESICGQVYRYSPNLSFTRVTKAHLFSHKRITTTRWSATSHLNSVNACLWDITFPFERINHARSGMIHQALHQGFQHPLKRKFLFPSATVIIWVSQYDHELTTLPRVYSSRSCVCPLFHPRNHALLLCESLALSPKSPSSTPPLTMGQPIKGWSIYVLILWVLQCHYWAHHLDKSQLVPGTCACPLLIPSSRVLMLHKSPTYCPRQMSSSSLIFSMGAISMKVNLAFVFILIIATSLAIHMSTHI
jgi:hypothetical protein